MQNKSYVIPTLRHPNRPDSDGQEATVLFRLSTKAKNAHLATP